jgi:pimeloyl-ACP methyl ester carboxylesterase
MGSIPAFGSSAKGEGMVRHPGADSIISDQTITARGLRFHVRTWRLVQDGDAVRPAVVLLHGLASAVAIWDLVAPLVVGAGLRVLALDQRGHGESDKPDEGYDFATIVEDDHAVLAGLHLDRAVIVGHSWGGAVALRLAITYPEIAAALVLIDGGFTQLSSRGWTRDEAIRALTPPQFAGTPVRDFLARIRAGPLGQQWTDELAGIMLRIVQEQPDGTVAPRLAFANHMRIVAAMWDEPTLAHYERLHCPTLLVSAEDDAASDFARVKREAIATIQAKHRHVQAVIVPATIHDIPLQRPELVAALIIGIAGVVRN